MSYFSRREEHYCNNCGSKNHVYIDTSIAQAFECWACLSKQWLDDSCRLEYMVCAGRSHRQAEDDLVEGLPVFAISQAFIELEDEDE